jgi:hypothetical protein
VGLQYKERIIDPSMQEAIKGSTARSNPQILELRALEKWNGVLPQVTSGATPFISIPK